MDVSPERLLGLQVLDPQGGKLGTVVDVGLGSWRMAKFVLVRGETPRLQRVEMRGLALDGEALRVQALPT